MDILIYCLKIIYYFAFVFITYHCAKNSYKDEKDPKNISIVIIAILGLIIGYYSIICGPSEDIGDRYNYAYRFVNKEFAQSVKENSLGLYYIETLLHLFTNEESALFFTIGVTYFVLTIIAYNKYEKIYPMTLLLLGLSSYGLFGFYLFKQSIAIGFVAISIAYLFKNKKIISLIFLVIATFFHESAWIMFPLYILIIFFKNKKIIRILAYVFMIICVIFFNQINAEIIKIFSNIPGIDVQLQSYIDDEGNIIVNTNILTIFKGLPYFIITIYGFIKRKVLINKINNYDSYLIMSTFCSVTTILSMYMYWMWRFATYCYFPVFVFASQIYLNDENKKNRILFIFSIYACLFSLTLKLLVQYYFIYGGIV